jgi:hypothetical protein
LLCDGTLLRCFKSSFETIWLFSSSLKKS